MRRWTALVGLVAALAMAGSALAQEPGAKKKRGRGKGTREAGTFVSATADAGTITWKLTAKDGTEKIYTMPDEVIVDLYDDTNGNDTAMLKNIVKNTARGIGPKGKREPKAKGNMKLCVGRFLKAEDAGKSFTMIVKGIIVTADAAAAGEAAEQTFTMSKKLVVMTREQRGETRVMRIMAARRPRKGKGDKPAGEKKPRKKGGRKKKGGAPGNM